MLFAVHEVFRLHAYELPHHIASQIGCSRLTSQLHFVQPLIRHWSKCRVGVQNVIFRLLVEL